MFETSNRTVVKSLVFPRQYENERDVYQHLARFAISDVRGFAVPGYVDSHDELLIVEMSYVSRPCVLDFASAGLLRPLVEYPEEVLEETLQHQQEMFEDRWPEVRRVVYAFEQLDVYLTDVNPGNVLFAIEDSDTAG